MLELSRISDLELILLYQCLQSCTPRHLGTTNVLALASGSGIVLISLYNGSRTTPANTPHRFLFLPSLPITSYFRSHSIHMTLLSVSR